MSESEDLKLASEEELLEFQEADMDDDVEYVDLSEMSLADFDSEAFDKGIKAPFEFEVRLDERRIGKKKLILHLRPFGDPDVQGYFQKLQERYLLANPKYKRAYEKKGFTGIPADDRFKLTLRVLHDKVIEGWTNEDGTEDPKFPYSPENAKLFVHRFKSHAARIIALANNEREFINLREEEIVGNSETASDTT